FASTTTYLKRRFSSGDLSGESYEEKQDEDQTPKTFSNVQSQQQSDQASTSSSGISLNFMSSNITGTPVSPARGVSGLLSRATSLTGSVTNTVQQQLARATSQVAAAIKDRHKILLIIDDQIVDWSKYFRGRRLIGDWDIKVEQAEFKDINVIANSELGVVVSIHTVDRNGYKIARTFRTDFILLRQHLIDCNQNYSNIIIGFKYGQIPTINSLQSFYNFQNKSWIYSNLLILQRKYGREEFPLIEQTFHPIFKDSSGVPKLPCVAKIGSQCSGMGKIKIENINQFQDIRSVLMMVNDYCIIEPFIDAKYDFIVQKIGTNYKVFTRKSISGNWKANIGSVLLEQQPINEKYKKWIDDVSELFGGLDICSLEGVIGKDGKEYILKIRGSDMILLGETQEEDRKNIVDLIMSRMNTICKNLLIKQQSRSSIPNQDQQDTPQAMAHNQLKRSSITSTTTHPHPPTQSVLPMANVLDRQGSKDAPPRPLPPAKIPSKLSQQQLSTTSANLISNTSLPPNTSLLSSTRKNSQGSTIKDTNPFASFDDNFGDNIDSSNAIQPQQQPQKPNLTKRESQSAIDEIKDEVDDTMRNLRKTFAGIFGDM
ncbi:Synapsin, partial [Sarcoptes scabiei]